MKCVNCGLINPEGSILCDCGYNFSLNKMDNNYKNKSEKKVSAPLFLAILCFFPLFFIFSVIYIEFFLFFIVKKIPSSFAWAIAGILIYIFSVFFISCISVYLAAYLGTDVKSEVHLKFYFDRALIFTIGGIFIGLILFVCAFSLLFING